MLGFVFEWKRVGFFAASLQALQIYPRDDRGKIQLVVGGGLEGLWV